jgi:hypothetical protein
MGQKYIDSSVQDQEEWMAHPQGDIYYIVMSTVAGEDVSEIAESLTDAQISSIRRQATQTLE